MSSLVTTKANDNANLNRRIITTSAIVAELVRRDDLKRLRDARYRARKEAAARGSEAKT